MGSNPTFSAKIKPSVRAAFSFEGGIRKAALGNVPVAHCNRRGFSAEKESHLLRQSAALFRKVLFFRIAKVMVLEAKLHIGNGLPSLYNGII